MVKVRSFVSVLHEMLRSIEYRVEGIGTFPFFTTDY